MAKRPGQDSTLGDRTAQDKLGVDCEMRGEKKRDGRVVALGEENAFSDAVGRDSLLSAKRPAFGGACCSPREPGSESTYRTEVDDATFDISLSLLEELKSLSVAERNLIQEDVHGVADCRRLAEANEEPERLRELLARMQRSVDAADSKPAYTHARFLDPSSVRDRQLQIMMLRADRYDPLAAARRLIRYFEFQQELFGSMPISTNEGAGAATAATEGTQGSSRPWITQDDLTPGMRRLLRGGTFQVSPYKDCSGRSIVFMHKKGDLNDWRSFLGMNWYVYQQALRYDESAQINGLVAVVHDTGRARLTSEYLTCLQKSAQFVEAVPFRLASYHYLYNDPLFRPLLRHLRDHLSKAVRLRVCPHYGTFMECVYHLMTYGITLDMLPADFAGNVKTEKWIQMLDRWRDEEQFHALQKAEERGIVLKMQDVVLGRGRPFQEFPGNQHLAMVINLNRPRYAEISRQDKTVMAEAIVAYVQTKRSGRFLKRDENNQWVAVSGLEARNKVSHGFRAPAKQVPGEDGIKLKVIDMDKVAIVVPDA